MTTTPTPSTVTPVATSGWYERTDGTVGYYWWTGGGTTTISCSAVVADWAGVAEYEARAEAAEQQREAEQRERDRLPRGPWQPGDGA